MYLFLDSSLQFAFLLGNKVLFFLKKNEEERNTERQAFICSFQTRKLAYSFTSEDKDNIYIIHVHHIHTYAHMFKDEYFPVHILMK